MDLPKGVTMRPVHLFFAALVVACLASFSAHAQSCPPQPCPWQPVLPSLPPTPYGGTLGGYRSTGGFAFTPNLNPGLPPMPFNGMLPPTDFNRCYYPFARSPRDFFMVGH
jgi:hypothetical protein